MANLNNVMLIGRLTRDPESRTFSGGGKVVQFGFVVNNSKKDKTGKWVDEPVWLDCEAYSSEYKKVGDTIEKYCKRGSQVYLGGHLKLDQWDDKATGQKRTKLKIVVDLVQLLDGKPQGGSEFPPLQAPRGTSKSAAPQEPHDSFAGSEDDVPW